jgi:hypothetical protein
VIALTINPEELSAEPVPLICDAIRATVGLPAWDLPGGGAERRVEILLPLLYLLWDDYRRSMIARVTIGILPFMHAKNGNWNRRWTKYGSVSESA